MNLRGTTIRWLPAAIGSLLFAFGVACLNYTKAGTLEHHQQWAGEHGMPAPGSTVFWGGVASAAIGAFAIGFFLPRRRPGR